MATSTTPSPKSPEQSEKSKKYDRQLRLWGDHGQATLESAHVCLINATATGTEILKSLVLPGICAFTIIDNKHITDQDLGNNFFLDGDYKTGHRNRGKVACQLLLELNADVKGDFVDENPHQLLQNNPEFFSVFSIVIGTDMDEKLLCDLSSYLWDCNIPFLVCKSYGLVGYMRLQVTQHTVIESHPDNAFDDLRLTNPFGSLEKFMDSINLDELTKKEHSHIPYVVILYKYLKKYRDICNKLPGTYKEREELKKMIRAGIWAREDGIEDEENFEEAIKAVNTAVTPHAIPESVLSIFNAEECHHISSQSKPFWLLAWAVRQFVENEGCNQLPLRGAIPDMTSDSQTYIALQSIYREQAKVDSEIVSRYVRTALQQTSQPVDSVSDNDVKLFCRNAHFLRVIRGSSLKEEYNSKLPKAYEWSSELENGDCDIIYYVILRAVERFQTEYGRYPGTFLDQVEPDIVNLKAHVTKLLNEWSLSLTVRDDYVHEMCRYGGAELHTVAAYVGGCAAHEAIKVITGQYVPIDNTMIYNAITGATSTFKL